MIDYPNQDLFLKIINKEIPSEEIYSDDDVYAFRDIQAQAPEHILIIPKERIFTINHLEEDQAHLIGKMFLAAKKIAEKLGVDKKGYRLVMNVGEGAGQSVFHIHLHLLAGRPFSWPPG